MIELRLEKKTGLYCPHLVCDVCGKGKAGIFGWLVNLSAEPKGEVFFVHHGLCWVKLKATYEGPDRGPMSMPVEAFLWQLIVNSQNIRSTEGLKRFLNQAYVSSCWMGLTGPSTVPFPDTAARGKQKIIAKIRTDDAKRSKAKGGLASTQDGINNG